MRNEKKKKNEYLKPLPQKPSKRFRSKRKGHGAKANAVKRNNLCLR